MSGTGIKLHPKTDHGSVFRWWLYYIVGAGATPWTPFNWVIRGSENKIEAVNLHHFSPGLTLCSAWINRGSMESNVSRGDVLASTDLTLNSRCDVEFRLRHWVGSRQAAVILLPGSLINSCGDGVGHILYSECSNTGHPNIIWVLRHNLKTGLVFKL
jgi:hypothetical protein